MNALEAAAKGSDLDLISGEVASLEDLVGCPQTQSFHAEGDVATHTQLVYELARTHAETLPEGWEPAVLRLAALLHDVGKPLVTEEVEPGVFTSYNHAEVGGRIVVELFGSHPALVELPLGVAVSVDALVRSHMLTFHIDRIRPGHLLKLTHLLDPAVLVSLWRADTQGRLCDDAAALAEQVDYAELVLNETTGGQVDAWGILAAVTDVAALPPGIRREVCSRVFGGALVGAGETSAALAAAEKNRRGSLTYTVGLPGLGKSTWARDVWRPRTDGVVLSAEGGRQRDRRAARTQMMDQLPKLLGAGTDVCLDATNLSSSARGYMLGIAGRYRADVHAVYFDAPTSVAVQRQGTRPWRDGVPVAVVREMARKLDWPAPDEYGTLTVVPAVGDAWEYNPTTRLAPSPGRPSRLEH